MGTFRKNSFFFELRLSPLLYHEHPCHVSSEKKKRTKTDSGPSLKTDSTRQVQRRACQEGRRKEAHEG